MVVDVVIVVDADDVDTVVDVAGVGAGVVVLPHRDSQL